MNKALELQNAQKSAVARMISEGLRGQDLIDAIRMVAYFVAMANIRPTEVLRLAEGVLKEHGLLREARTIHADYLEAVKSAQEE